VLCELNVSDDLAMCESYMCPT